MEKGHQGRVEALIGCSVWLLGKRNPEYPRSISLWESLSHTARGGRRHLRVCPSCQREKRGESLGRQEKERGRRKGMARWAGLPRIRRKEGVGVRPWLSLGRDSGGGEVFFLFSFFSSFTSKPISNPF